MSEASEKRAIKEAVRKRDGYKCVDCGKPQRDYFRHGRPMRFDVHRVTPKGQYSLENCVTLCRTCHGKRHGRPARDRPAMPGKHIRWLLILKEWTRQDLADRLGISQNTVDRWFVGPAEQKRYPSPENAALMRRWLNEAREEARSQPA